MIFLHLFIIFYIFLCIISYFTYKIYFDIIFNSAILSGYDCDKDTGVIEMTTTRNRLYIQLNQFKVPEKTETLWLILIILISFFYIGIIIIIFSSISDPNFIIKNIENLFIILILFIYFGIMLAMLVKWSSIGEGNTTKIYKDILLSYLYNNCNKPENNKNNKQVSSQDNDYKSFSINNFDYIDKCNSILENAKNFYKIDNNTEIENKINQENDINLSKYIILDHRHKNFDFSNINSSNRNFINNTKINLDNENNTNTLILDDYKNIFYGFKLTILSQYRQFDLLWFLVLIILVYIFNIIWTISSNLLLGSFLILFISIILYIMYDKIII
jgi:hypothetical protein